jgi:hypothetical protein
MSVAWMDANQEGADQEEQAKKSRSLGWERQIHITVKVKPYIIQFL